MIQLRSLLTRTGRGADRRYGTGLWRHNRDRFLRAVDRYYSTAVAIHETSPAAASESADASALETIVVGTHRLGELASEIDEITALLHSRFPLTGQIVPGPARQALGDVPELLTRASAKVAEAVLAASMARTDPGALVTTAAATHQYISDAADLLDRVRRTLAEVSSP